jgi:tetratricopeptide (TPR) repeat protein
MAEVKVRPENCPPLVPQSNSQIIPTTPDLPRVVDEVKTAPAVANERVPLTDINVIRPDVQQLSTSAAAPADPNLQVQPQVMTMPTTLIRRAGESLAATSAAQSAPTKPVEASTTTHEVAAESKPLVDPFSTPAQSSPSALPVVLPPGVTPPVVASAPSAPAVPQMPRMMPESNDQATSRVMLTGGTQPRTQTASAVAASELPAAAPAPSKPLSPQQLVDRAASEFEHQDLEKSLGSYDRALEQSPSYMPALIGRAKIYRHLGLFDESLADSTRLIRTYPENSEGFLERGLTRAAMGLVPEAAEDFDMAVQLDANNVSARLERGKARLLMRDLAAALADYNEVVRLAPGMTRGYIERARVLKLMGRTDDALDDYAAAIQLDGQGIDGLVERALLYLELKKLQASLTDLNAAIDRAPGDARIYVARARLYRHGHAWREAQEDLNAAERLDPLSKPLQMERDALRSQMPKSAQASNAGS